MTTPSGKLAWGQAGVYDAIDDRSAIAAVTRNRIGLTWPVTVVAGTGLNLTVRGGWLGVAACGDGTSAVVGSRTDLTVTGLTGPATGSRQDLIWCDVQPDNGTWSLSVINASAAAGRTGLPLAYLTVPANATLATQFTILGADATLERRLVAFSAATETNTRTGNSFATVGAPVTATAWAYPGQYYRIRFSANSPASLSGGPDLRMAIGVRVPGQADTAATQLRACAIAVPALNRPMATELTYVYRYPVASAAAQRTYDGRIWITGTGSLRTCLITNLGDGVTLSVEDLGS